MSHNGRAKDILASCKGEFSGIHNSDTSPLEAIPLSLPSHFHPQVRQLLVSVHPSVLTRVRNMVVVKDENKSYDKDPVWMFLRILLPPFCLDTTTNRDNSSFLNRNERAKKNVCDRPSDERWPHLTDDGRWKIHSGSFEVGVSRWIKFIFWIPSSVSNFSRNCFSQVEGIVYVKTDPLHPQNFGRFTLKL